MSQRLTLGPAKRFVPCITLIVLLISCVSYAQSVSFEETAYFYDSRGKRAVAVSDSEFLIHLSTGEYEKSKTRPSSLPDRITPPNLPKAAIDLEDRLERRGLYVVREVRLGDVKGFPGVDYALPLLHREGSDVPIYQTNRLVVALKDGLQEAELKAFAEAHQCNLSQCERGTLRYILTVPDPQASEVLDLANALHERADLTQYAHPDFFLPKITMTPPVIDDPFYHSHQWHLDGDIAKGADANSDINVEAAWDTDFGPYAQGRHSVAVAILDECVEKMHPDLYPNWTAGIDLDNDPPDDDPSPDSSQRHGTSCAGVAVGVGNTIGVRGAAPQCGLIGVKFFGGTIAETAEGFYFAMDPNNDGDHSDGAAILSNSWGYADGTLLPGDVATAINVAATTGRDGLGCLVLFAAANNDHTVDGVSALAQMPTVFTVGGTNSHAKHTEFSDVGPEVDIATPTNDRGDDGVRLPWLDITTVDNTGSSGYNGLTDLDYTNGFGGTSSATPLAAGVLGLIISHDPSVTAAQARAILQHTAVRIDEPYGRFDGITGHSHRLGYGRADAANAAAAAYAGLRWPDRIGSLNATVFTDDISLTWSTPAADYFGSLLVRSATPFAWMPEDGQSYSVGQAVIPGVEVIYSGVTGSYVDEGANTGGYFYAVYPYSTELMYGFGAKTHVIRDALTLFYDSCETVDPGWTHGGPGDEWSRGAPTSANAIFGQSVAGSGPLGGADGLRAIGGHKCWGTDLYSTYNAYADAWLKTPLINLAGVDKPVFLEYYDWCLLETYYDTCVIEVLNEDDQIIGTIDGDTGGDYDWTRRIYDISAFTGQAISIRFRITTDGVIQRDGWFLDEIRVTVAGSVAIPPVANDLYLETTQDTTVAAVFKASDPNPGQILDYVITSLPAHGDLTDPNGDTVTSAPYTLINHGSVALYTPHSGYQGPDTFNYVANDGQFDSNEADVNLSVGTPLVAYEFPLNTDPGWLTEGQWEFGHPLGLEGDPAAAYTGVNIFGYNLAGIYPDGLAPQYLTTLPLNCAGMSRVTLQFARWLGVEDSSWDSANIEVSVDGNLWHTVWSHSGDDLEETEWGVQAYHLGQVVDNQPFVQVRWGMGPTDDNTGFCGWNIDDVQILAIGDAPDNQPPYARNLRISTALDTPVAVTLAGSDSDDDPVQYTIVELPAHGQISDPNGGVISAVPYQLLADGNVVDYMPSTGYAGTDEFQYQVDDGILASNVAGVSVTVIHAAPFPFTETFEAGPPLSIHWSTDSTATGRIAVTDNYEPDGNYHLTMDSSYEGTYSLNQLTLAVDLEAHSRVLLRFDWKDFEEDADPLPDSWQGSFNGDGVAISADGITWHRIADLFDPAAKNGDETSTGLRGASYQTVLIDLDQAVANAGVAYSNTFRIRFQQYDSHPIDTDGIALDNIYLIQGTADPVVTTTSLPTAYLNESYGPASLAAAGGDLPLTWSLVDTYGEEMLESSLFEQVGVAQGWQAGNSVFDYTLPFAFPFYGEDQTTAKIACDGWINFGNYVGSTYNNSELLLSYNKRIAVLWDNLRTDSGGDIYVDESVPGQVTIRWDAVTHTGLLPCEFSATLFQDGRIRFHYGDGCTGLTPTIGVSAGDQVSYSMSMYDGSSQLTDSASVEFDQSKLPTGLILHGTGLIDGVPTQAGRYKPVVEVEDSSGRTDRRLIPILAVQRVYGDYDLDGDLDLDDFSWFPGCMEQMEPSPDCLRAFDDESGVIDLMDFARFQSSFAEALD